MGANENGCSTITYGVMFNACTLMATQREYTDVQCCSGEMILFFKDCRASKSIEDWHRDDTVRDREQRYRRDYKRKMTGEGMGEGGRRERGRERKRCKGRSSNGSSDIITCCLKLCQEYEIKCKEFWAESQVQPLPRVNLWTPSERVKKSRQSSSNPEPLCQALSNREWHR